MERCELKLSGWAPALWLLLALMVSKDQARCKPQVPWLSAIPVTAPRPLRSRMERCELKLSGWAPALWLLLALMVSKDQARCEPQVPWLGASSVTAPRP